nr:hypothetical protein [Tanacetum cinerariifolium]
MEDTLSKFISKSARRHEESSNLIKEIRASTDAAIRIQGASIKTLEIQIGQMSKVLQERGFGSLPSSTETNPKDHVKSISTIVEVDLYLIRRASVSVMPLSTYLNLGLDELSHTKLTVELADRTVKYPKGIAENVLVEARLIGETLVLNRSLDHFFEDYIELNDFNVPLELRRDQVDDLMPTIVEGEVVEEFKARNDARMGLAESKEIEKVGEVSIIWNLMLPKTRLTFFTSPWPFYQWGLDILVPLPEGPGKLKFIIVAIYYFTKWMEAKPLAKTTDKEVQKFVWKNIVCRFGLLKVIVTGNETQLVNDPFKIWCEKWKIKYMNTTVAHPQANRLVKRANKSLILTYGSEAAILTEIGMPTYQTIQFNEAQNEEEMRINLDLIEKEEKPQPFEKRREEILVVMNDKDEDVDYSSFIIVMFDKVISLLSAESEDTLFDPGISD